MAKVEVQYWKDINENDENKYIPKFALDCICPEFDCVNEWYPLFLAKGARNIRSEIVRLWTGLYPDRASNNKFYNKLMRHCDWWDKHTDMRNSVGDKKQICTKVINI